MSNSKIRVFHIVKWYPNFEDDLAGIFIPRHISSLSEKCENFVFYSRKLEGKKRTIVQDSQYGNFKEYITYYPNSITGFAFLDRLLKFFFYFKYISELINECSKAYGKPDIIHTHVMGRSVIIGNIFKRRWNVPMVHTEHWSVFQDMNWEKKSWIWKFIIKRIINKPNVLLPVSEKLAQDMKNKGLKKKTKVVYNVVDTDKFSLRKLHNNLIFRFIHVSDFTEFTKNVKGILSAFNLLTDRNPNVELVLVGYGAYENEIKNFATGLTKSHGKVRFTGKLQGKELIDELHQANAFILFSRYENLPCVIAEAMSCGLPVISSNVGGISEIINDQNGILVESENELQLKEAMETMISKRADYNPKKIRDYAINSFSKNTISNQIIEVYQSLM